MIRPCRKCGAVDRYPDGHCRACAHTNSASWRAENVEKKKLLDKAWAKKNPERARATKRRYYERNKENLKGPSKLSSRRYRAAHPDKIAARNKRWNERAGCNMQKHDKHPVDFMQSRGFLL